MDTKINIAEIIKDCPIGTKLWSPIFGEVILRKVSLGSEYCIEVVKYDCSTATFTKYGLFNSVYQDAECLLFPSKDNRDWSTFKPNKPKFDPKTLQPFDRVLVRDSYDATWVCDTYSHKYDNSFICSGFMRWDYCIPYNDETKHLAGTKKEEPEYYRYWED